MRKFFCAAIAAVCMTLCLATGCNGSVDYTDYISEKRSEIYLYKDDEIDFKIHCVSREQPYNSDGICGNMCEITEIFLICTPTPESVEIRLDGYSGEMNYGAVDRQFTASYSAPAFNSEGVDVTLTMDGKERSFRALSVLDKGVISCEQALKCAAEYDKELFSGLTSHKDFAGEIYVRLLYDEGCYYYVGVCDRQKNITAYLLDGGTGKVITSKKLSGS